MPTPDALTVVLPTYNRAAGLTRCLRGLMAGPPPGLRVTVLLMDDGSTDETPLVPGSLEAERPAWLTLHHVRLPNGGPAAARNAGWRQADTEWVLFLDDDCEPLPGWLAAWARVDFDANVGGAGGRIASADASTQSARYCRYLRFNEFADPPEPIRYVNTANCAYRRRLLAELGGFETLFREAGGEDVDLALRVVGRGQRLLYQPEAAVVHHHRETREVLFRTFRVRGSASTLREALWDRRSASWRRLFIEASRLVLSHAALVALPLRAKRLTAVRPEDRLVFAYLDWQRAAGMRRGKLRMLLQILTGRQSLTRSAVPSREER